MIGVIPGQMTLDLFPKEREPSPLESCVSHLVSRGCDEAKVRPMVEELYGMFGAAEAFDRAKCLEYFYGVRPIPRLRACSPMMIGLFDRTLDYHVVWDRCWAARWRRSRMCSRSGNGATTTGGPTPGLRCSFGTSTTRGAR